VKVAEPGIRSADRLVVIGASVGGPAALCKLLGGLPKNFPAAVAIVQHVDEHFSQGMADWLGRASALEVRVAREGDHLEPGTVLLASSSDHLVVKVLTRVGYTPEPREQIYRPSIDVFFDSVRANWPGEVVGVLLTGMGDDGARGLKALRAHGYHTIAQDEASCAIYGMPKAAAALGAAVQILPLECIAQRLCEIFRPGT
jgi:two-component system, chemotaxis family, response regulator WspF